MKVGNHIFGYPNLTHYTDCLDCYEPGCSAYIIPCLSLDGEVEFRFFPHNKNLAHSHEDTPAPPPIPTVKVTTVQQMTYRQQRAAPTDYIHPWVAGGRKATTLYAMDMNMRK